MGYKQITIKLPTGYDEALLRKEISQKSGLRDFTYVIENKSLDARNKSNIHWQVRVLVSSAKLKGDDIPRAELTIPYKKRNKKVVVVGSGPAGFFAALVLQKAGYHTAIIGKWHLRKEPSGFDYYNVLNNQGRYWDPILKTKENFHKQTVQLFYRFL